MKKEEIIRVQKYESELFGKMSFCEKIYGIQDVTTVLYRSEWVGVYRTMKMLGIPVDYELREEVF